MLISVLLIICLVLTNNFPAFATTYKWDGIFGGNDAREMHYGRLIGAHNDMCCAKVAILLPIESCEQCG